MLRGRLTEQQGRQADGLHVGLDAEVVVRDRSEVDHHIGPGDVDYRVAGVHVVERATADRAGRHQVALADDAMEGFVRVAEAQQIVPLVAGHAGEDAARPIAPQVIALARRRAMEEERRASLDLEAIGGGQLAQPRPLILGEVRDGPCQRELAGCLRVVVGPYHAWVLAMLGHGVVPVALDGGDRQTAHLLDDFGGVRATADQIADAPHRVASERQDVIEDCPQRRQVGVQVGEHRYPHDGHSAGWRTPGNPPIG